MEPVELYDIGTDVFDAFEGLLDLNNENQVTRRHHLASEAQRFRLWAHSLGLHQQGHASLDYRVRDAVVVKDRLAEILSELLEHLGNLLAIAKGERLPYEQDVAADTDEDDDTNSITSDAESHDSKQSHSNSDGSVHEVDFRLQNLSESLDALYSLATKIRNPRNRPQRTNNQLYKRIPAEVRATFIEEREAAEIATIAWIQRHHLIEGINRLEAVNLQLKPEELIDRYASRSEWLVCRIGIANARRKQQFVYWKDHALRLSHAPIHRKPAIPIIKHTTEGMKDEPIAIPQSQFAPSVATKQAALVVAPSLATSATKLEADFVKPEDLKSVISHQSYVSTVINVKGEKVEWPAPPTQITSNGYFTCPYCKILCPQRYLAKNAWQVHLIHDIQPYHCTYEECLDPHRLYGTRQEWIDHESQHSRVWHCQMHGEEFETQPDYVAHLKTSHPEAMPEHFSPELVATVVGPSLKPHRACPLCHTAFSDTIEMQKHMTFHLERFALLALPPLIRDGSNEDSSGHPSDSHEVQHHGRQGSILGDFDDAEKLSFTEIHCRTIQRPYKSLILDKKMLSQIPSFEDSGASTVLAWLETSEPSDADPNINQTLSLPMPFSDDKPYTSLYDLINTQPSPLFSTAAPINDPTMILPMPISEKATTFADLAEVSTSRPNAVTYADSSRERSYGPPSTPPPHGREASARRQFSFQNMFRRHQADADVSQQTKKNATEEESVSDEISTAKDSGAASTASDSTERRIQSRESPGASITHLTPSKSPSHEEEPSKRRQFSFQNVFRRSQPKVKANNAAKEKKKPQKVQYGTSGRRRSSTDSMFTHAADDAANTDFIPPSTQWSRSQRLLRDRRLQLFTEPSRFAPQSTPFILGPKPSESTSSILGPEPSESTSSVLGPEPSDRTQTSGLKASFKKLFQ